MDRISENIGYFEELDCYMNKIIHFLLCSEKIVKILKYTDKDMYQHNLPTNVYELLYKNLYPYGYTPDIETKTDTYLTVEFDRFKPTRGGHFIYSYVVFSMFAHEALQNTNFGNRLLLLCDEVHKVVEANNRSLGIGKFQLRDGGVIPNLQKPYYGHYLMYELVDFDK